jgi:hypothetical protein
MMRPSVERRRRRDPGRVEHEEPAAPPTRLPEAESAVSPALPETAEVPAPLDVPLSSPEPEFAARVAPVPPPAPLPSARRAVFFDVENTSRAEHVAHMIDHLALDRPGHRIEFVAVGNWRVIGADTARLLARHGAQLVHSAPSTGVRDWSDLRIAVSAGVWLAGARPGDLLEIVSDDRAFDAVGDVAAALRIAFRRISYRAVPGGPAPAEAETEEAPREAPRRGGRRGRRRGRRAPSAHPAPTPARPPAEAAESGEAGHTAPHDEVVHLLRELASRSPSGSVLIDTLANALKSRGFRRPPGSPRLITRLRRMHELSVSPNGMITLVGGGGTDGGQPQAAAVAPEVEPETAPAAATAPSAPGRRRRSRRGGRRRRRSTHPSPP